MTPRGGWALATPADCGGARPRDWGGGQSHGMGAMGRDWRGGDWGGGQGLARWGLARWAGHDPPTIPPHAMPRAAAGLAVPWAAVGHAVGSSGSCRRERCAMPRAAVGRPHGAPAAHGSLARGTRQVLSLIHI
eukprot:3563812-Prymnesium_polylepis.2